MSVLLMLFVFALFITLDVVVARRRARREGVPAHSAEQAAKPIPIPIPAEPVWVAGYQMPQELHYHRGHTWARFLDPETVVIGLDDFARKLLGKARRWTLPPVGAAVQQGEASFRAGVDGKEADMLSPVDGQVLRVNPELEENPELATDDPYGRGWVMQVRASNPSRDRKNLLSGTLAGRWMEDARERMERQLMALSGSVLQDGGEPVSDLAHHLSPEEWDKLVGEFLLT
jgi:glycine cleavage system H protein